jgi:hypothetical protein
MNWVWPFNGRAGNGKRNKANGCRRAGVTPDFLCIGLHKCGTTWLYQQLDAHPDFWMPPVKELHYFDQLGRVHRASAPRCRDERDLRFVEGLKSLSAKSHIDLDAYARLFEPKGALLSGDVSPNYSTLSDEVIRKVVGYFPELKVIFLARDPVERVWSHLSMEVHYHQIEPFDATDTCEVDRKLRRRGMLLRSYPSAVVARWKRYVQPNRFRVYFFDDLQRNPTQLRRSIVHFLGADPDKFATANPPCEPGSLGRAEHNGWANMEKLVLTDNVRSHLARFFKKELKECASRLGGPAKHWLERYGFSLLLLFWDLLDDTIDLFFWCDWIS